MLARAFASAPFNGAKMQAFVSGSENGAKHPPYGPDVLRAVFRHFDAHLAFLPTNLASALPVPVSHLASSLFGSVTGGNCAATVDTSRPHKPAAAITDVPNDTRMSLPSSGWSWDARAYYPHSYGGSCGELRRISGYTAGRRRGNAPLPDRRGDHSERGGLRHSVSAVATSSRPGSSMTMRNTS